MLYGVEVWVEPSRGQRFWLRHAPSLFAPGPDQSGFIRWWAIATVTPSTNVTGLNLPYQAYLDAIFHRTGLARVGHAVCMPIIVTALLGATSPPVGAVVLAVWWVSWALKWRDAWWGWCSLALAGGLAAVAFLVPWPRPTWLLIALVGSLLQAASHALEPLPPRVTRSPHWMPVGKYLLEGPGRVRRLGHLAAQVMFGTVDELVASPRLLPVLLLRLLWLTGHDATRRREALDLAHRAIASGNPALDYIGTGGGAPLPVAGARPGGS
jgi:hypothetical protein